MYITPSRPLGRRLSSASIKQASKPVSQQPGHRAGPLIRRTRCFFPSGRQTIASTHCALYPQRDGQAEWAIVTWMDTKMIALPLFVSPTFKSLLLYLKRNSNYGRVTDSTESRFVHVTTANEWFIFTQLFVCMNRRPNRRSTSIGNSRCSRHKLCSAHRPAFFQCRSHVRPSGIPSQIICVIRPFNSFRRQLYTGILLCTLLGTTYPPHWRYYDYTLSKLTMYLLYTLTIVSLQSIKYTNTHSKCVK